MDFLEPKADTALLIDVLLPQSLLLSQHHLHVWLFGLCYEIRATLLHIRHGIHHVLNLLIPLLTICGNKTTFNADVVLSSRLL
jgi:hypothetical protein